MIDLLRGDDQPQCKHKACTHNYLLMKKFKEGYRVSRVVGMRANEGQGNALSVCPPCLQLQQPSRALLRLLNVEILLCFFSLQICRQDAQPPPPNLLRVFLVRRRGLLQ